MIMGHCFVEFNIWEG